MKRRIISIVQFIVFILSIQSTLGQVKIIVPDLSKINDEDTWTLYNRDASFDEAVLLDGRQGDGLALLDGFHADKCTIEVEIRGRNEPGRSFVGIAFHIENDSTFDAIYFRPFNFENPNRNSHSVQYISHPTWTWSRLREQFPGKYENTINPVPDPAGWFKARIEINFPFVKVFVEDSEKACLEVEQISKRGSGKIGLWVGNTSEGDFRNLKITPN